jgi:hypothetical protein
MANAESVLGKRAAEDKEVTGQRLDLSLALATSQPSGDKPKRGRRAAEKLGQVERKDVGSDPVAARTRKKAATGPGASGNLTSPDGGARQEQ